MNAFAAFSTAVAAVRGYGQRVLSRFRLLWSKLARKPD